MLSVKNILEKWDQQIHNEMSDKKRNQIRMILDGQEFVLFFRYNKDIYGSTEPHRVTFAKIKDKNDEDVTDGWLKEANFVGINLSSAVRGKPVKRIFYAGDVDEIKIVDKDEAFEHLSREAENVPSNAVDNFRKTLLGISQIAKRDQEKS